jgi:DNA excision repair protein ERCC-4
LVPCHSIIADDRERASPIVDLLRQSPDFHVTVARLTLGDYLLDGQLLFERKTLTDLVAAIIEGRLFRQALRLAAASGAKRPAMILEGTSRDIPATGMTWEAIQGALVTVTLCCGIPILRTRSPIETVQTLRFAARQARAHATSALPRPGWRPRGKAERQLYILQGLPGIGPGRARRLLMRFGSVAAVMNADAENLQSVAGIGRQLAEKIRWSVEEFPSEYRLLPACLYPTYG